MKSLMTIGLTIILNTGYSQTYCAGDEVGDSHLSQNFEVCYASDEYSVGDQWSLADYDGELNGGEYHVIFIDMSATW